MGRHGVPSLVIAMKPVVRARPARLLSTRSKRMRGDAPKTVALRRNVGEKSSSAIAPTSRSTSVLHVAYAVCGLVGRRLVDVFVGGDAIDAARRRVDEPRDAGRLGERREMDGSLVVDVVGDLRRQLTDRVVGELRHVDHRVESGDVGRLEIADVAAHGQGQPIWSRVEPSPPVVAAVDADHVVAALHEVGREQRADVAVASGDEHPQEAKVDDRADVVVVGGGIVGLATAYRLAQSRPGGSHHRAREGSGCRPAPELAQLGGAACRPLLRARLAEGGAVPARKGRGRSICRAAHGIPVVRNGKLVVAVDERELPALAALTERARSERRARVADARPRRVARDRTARCRRASTAFTHDWRHRLRARVHGAGNRARRTDADERGRVSSSRTGTSE